MSVKWLRISLGFAWLIPDMICILCGPKVYKVKALGLMFMSENPSRNPMVRLGRFIGFLTPIGLVFRVNST